MSLFKPVKSLFQPFHVSGKAVADARNMIVKLIPKTVLGFGDNFIDKYPTPLAFL